MDQTITRILQIASENPAYQSIADYLMSRRAYPQMQLDTLPSSRYGSFTSPGLFSDGRIPERGVVNINRYSKYQNPADVAPVVAHELTHATERQLIKQYYEIKNKNNKTDLDNQFLSNFQKIIGSSESQINNWLKSVAPEFVKKEGDYRATGKEALAFGLESAAFPNYQSEYQRPAHIDPTIATSLMLLLDQAQRVQNQQPQSQGR